MTTPAPLTGEALRRLEAEWWPDGTYGGARHPGGARAHPDPDAAQHYADLAEAIAYRITPRTPRHGAA
ncbi:hypothetical protein ACFXCZ_27285 [Streptomyces sp. NPDC059396]|uniref:hypothetical protein n=1 Tax=Streptomyces sp. NPDC059396 TaxID=3346819 RepID=UPI0036C25069